jgi:hypothetical protein
MSAIASAPAITTASIPAKPVGTVSKPQLSTSESGLPDAQASLAKLRSEAAHGDLQAIKQLAAILASFSTQALLGGPAAHTGLDLQA